MPKLDNRPRFWNLFWINWSQNQDPGLKLKASIITRQGAPAGTCPGAFWTAICWDPSEIHKNIHYLWLYQEFLHPRIGQTTKVWEICLKNLISESRSRAETRGIHTNSARRVHWNPFWPTFHHRCDAKGGSDFGGLGPIFSYGVA